jgi:L-ribulose-5-phosphate 3-epimerase UlaE
MKYHIGIKSDPIQNRYSYDWLFCLMKSLDIKYLQLGGFLEMPLVDDGYYFDLVEKATHYGIRIKSVYATYRATAGFCSKNRYLEEASRRIYEVYIHAGKILGADYVGANAGVVYQDHPENKKIGIQCYLSNMQNLMHLAKENGIKALTVEVMSSYSEPPSTPEEIDCFMEHFRHYHKEHETDTVPVYLLGDVSHGYVNINKTIIHSNYEIFEYAIPYMCEFHFKNTDSIYNKTLGFSEEEQQIGIVNLEKIREIIYRNSEKWPVQEIVGYLELPGPKFGRDYTDFLLEKQIIESVETIKRYL